MTSASKSSWWSFASNDVRSARRMRTLVDTHHDFIWRSLRRLGVAPADVDDGTQQVFLIAARKLEFIRSGCERRFLYQTALRIASDYRRTVHRRDEVAGDAEDSLVDSAPLAPELLEMRQAREQLDIILDEMPIDLRAIFVLYEIDEMSAPDIAALLEIPLGTVASRLRRARAEFSAAANRGIARAADGGSR
jgi:RNA polymerase sigma-70 factor (ECF subfamily)